MGLGRWHNNITGRTAGGGAPPDQYRQQVLTGASVLERTGDSLVRAQQVSTTRVGSVCSYYASCFAPLRKCAFSSLHQVAVETEAVGHEIIGDLGAQRETLERTRTRLVETDVELGRSRKILRKMYLNVFSNKIVLILIILIEVCILGGLLYWKYGTKHG